MPVPPEILINSTTCPEMEEELGPQRSSSDGMPKRSFNDRLRFYQEAKFTLETPAQLSGKFGLPKEEIIKVTEAVKAVLELYTIFGLESPRSPAWLKSKRQSLTSHRFVLIQSVNHVFYKTIHKFLNFVSVNGEGSWVKLLKWKFAALFAFYRDQELPPRPEFNYGANKKEGKHFCCWRPDVLLGGVCHDFLMNMKSTRSNRFKQFIDTSQQLKKAMPDVPVSMVRNAEIETRIKLTSPPTVTEPSVVVLVKNDLPFDLGSMDLATDVNRPKVEAALRRTVSEIFEGKSFTFEEVVEPFFPSTSANYIWSRNRCGALSELYAKLPFGKMGSGIEFGTEMCSLSQRVAPHYGSLGKKEEYHIIRDRQLGFEPTESMPVLFADSSQIRRDWEDQYFNIFDLAITEAPRVATVGLPEPLKVRVISKGPPLLYTALKPFQKWLWGVLKKNKVFSLIGRYVTEEDVNWVLGDLPETDIALSGDYVASTDKLHSWVSETILDQLMIEVGESISKDDLDRLPRSFLTNLKTLFLKALTKHIFVENEIEYPQTEGQLMGSIISFPFLCIANAALCRLSLEEADFNVIRYRLVNKPYPGSGRIAPLLINGDDCLLRGRKTRLRNCWEAFCALAGLNSSVGKTYFSNSFCTINSTIFEWNPETSWWTERKYVNLGLMMGRKRMGAGCNKDFNPQVGIHQLGTICRELKRSCPTELWPVVKKRFIYYNMKELSSFPVPWFLPEWLGGVGLPVDHPDEISVVDRKCATIIKMFMNKNKNLKPVKPKDAAMWLMHKRVLRDLRPFEYLGQPLYRNGRTESGIEFQLEEEFAKLYKLLTIDLLMKEPLESLYDLVDKDKNVVKALWHNSSVFSTARHMLSTLECSIEPMSDEDLLYENKDLVIPCLNVDFVSTFFLPYNGVDESLL